MPKHCEHAVPDAVVAKELTRLLAPSLAGAPATGAVGDATAEQPAAVVWVDSGDEVIVHLDSLQVDAVGSVLLVALDLETDQTGRATIVVPFALADSAEGGSLMVTEGQPRGPTALVERWGEAVQVAAFQALVSLSETHALERQQRPGSVFLKDGRVHFSADPLG